MLIGVDFDNTIVCYDSVFHSVAVEKGLVSPDFPANKTAIRDFLRGSGRERLWTELQGLVYGPLMSQARPFPGVVAFFRECHAVGAETVVVSHKTRYPYQGQPHDLHTVAMKWLEDHQLPSPTGAGAAGRVFFEPSRLDKLRRIGTLRCSFFIDDLPEFLGESDFPLRTHRILFDPSDRHKENTEFIRIRRWADMTRELKIK